jgi:hypothetical protein
MCPQALFVPSFEFQYQMASSLKGGLMTDPIELPCPTRLSDNSTARRG